MNYLWGGMILTGIVYGTASGNLGAVTEAAIDSSKEAVSLCIVMAGVTALWVGIMRIAENSGLIDYLVGKMNPVIRFFFPDLPKNHPAGMPIAVNMIANVLGLGWAATPAGLEAMEELSKLEEERHLSGEASAGKLSEEASAGKAGRGRPEGTASNEMCTFLVLNISSLQLIPVNIIAYRSQYGSVNPSAVVGPGIVATAVSTLTAVIFCKIMSRRRGMNRRG
jgi:spore maturation protein A